MKKQVGIWIRVSTEDQAKGESPEHHEHRARMYAEAKGWNVKEVYHLEAVSGKSVTEHPEAKRMIKDIESGHITGLIFSKLARLARNTRELLDFSDFFKKCDADLISLHESIDTSSPAGRFFYTLIAAMAEWEREEIADRIKASVPIRAKLGKSLGGEAPFGYKWVNKRLEIDEKEAPVRKLMYELFLKYKRKRTVANVLNEQGYRPREGGKFGSTSIDRYLKDPIAKGLRRVNYTQMVPNKTAWVLKPKEEWVFQPAPAIISEELWDACNQILESTAAKNKRVRRRAVHLFSGIIQCECGSKMYMRSKSPRYVCNTCNKTKINPDDVEHIFREQLKNFLFSDTEIQKHLNEEKLKIAEHQKHLKLHQDKIAELRNKISNLLNLFYEGKVTKDAFEGYHTPPYQELKQRETSMTEIQSIIDTLNMQTLANDQVLHDARDLHSQWETFTPEEKRTIIEAITETIIVGKEDIEIKLNYIPTITKIEKPPSTTSTPTTPPSFNQIPSPILFLPIKLVQLLTKGLSVGLWDSRNTGFSLDIPSGFQGDFIPLFYNNSTPSGFAQNNPEGMIL